MLSYGVHKNNLDLRDFSFERTWGTVETKLLPDEYNADLALSFPDQIAEGRPNGCSGYTQAETGQDEYGVQFNPGFNYENSLLIEGALPNSPVQIRDALKSPRIYGLEPIAGGDPLTFRRGSYYDVDKSGDYFDGARSALYKNRLNKRTISAGSPWFSNWMVLGIDGVMPAPKKYVWDANTVGHNWKICGWKTIHGQPYIIVKAWLGPKWGDAGYGYMSREIFNKVMAISGTFMYVQVNFTESQALSIELDILELVLSLYRRILASLL